MRISNSIAKTQRIVFAEVFSERVETLTDKMLVEPYVFDFESNEENQLEKQQEDK